MSALMDEVHVALQLHLSSLLVQYSILSPFPLFIVTAALPADGDFLFTKLARFTASLCNRRLLALFDPFALAHLLKPGTLSLFLVSHEKHSL